MSNVPHEYKDRSPTVERYLEYKRVIQGRGAKTVEEYRSDLRIFCRFLIAKRNGLPLSGEEFDNMSIAGADDELLSSVSRTDVMEFMLYCADVRGCSPVSRARKLTAVRSMYKYFAGIERMVKENPAANVDSPAKKKVLPKYLTVDESIALLETVEENGDSKFRERDYCIITLFLNCGMRLSELVSINVGDIEREMRSLRVIGKGNKERIVYLNDACRSALRSWLSVRAADGEIKDRNALFISRLHTRISRPTVQWVVNKYLTAAGLGYKQLSVHKLRHTAATLMSQSGAADVLALKEILGHEQLSTTQIYTHIGNDALQKAAENHPLAKQKAK